MGLEMFQIQQTEQRLILTQTMRESLEMLQMPLPELREYLLDKALSNPILEVDESAAYSVWERPLPLADGPAQVRSREETSGHLDGWRSPQYNRDGGETPETEPPVHEQTFTEQLQEQLWGIEKLNGDMRKLCDYLILCLNDRGYLEDDLEELAISCGVPLFEMDQALYVIQSLQPTGVGARNLTECLLLQLAESKHFNSLTIRTAKEGLQLLSRNNMSGLSKLLACTGDEAKETAKAIRELNPIPSRGYSSGRNEGCQIPEAAVLIENGRLVLEMNRRFLPKIGYNNGIIRLLKQSGDAESMDYLRKNTQGAKQLIGSVEYRAATIERLLKRVIEYQSGYFLRGEPLRPMTMSQLAEELEVNISTISRCIRGKSISFRGRSLLLKDFFTNSLMNDLGMEVSSNHIKQQIQKFIQAEDPAKPLSDEEIRLALAGVQIKASRRTVAKYRDELGIACSTQRKTR